jgi:hypothetical protein
METIELEYLPKLKDYFEAYSLYESKTVLRKLDKIVSISLIIFGILILSASIINGFKVMNIIFAIIFIIIGVLDFLGFIAFEKIIILVQFKNNKKLKYLQKIRFSENGLEYETQGVRSTIEWTFYQNYYEGKNVFILIYGKRQYSVIPKNEFKNRLDDFRKLLNGKII